ncbi:MAG TPA: FGGY-family carbohydrate kinase, partial [Atribacterota bacterium]|nr:FGGY-family carbohydrate kinase [Atribacterota bacterium]
VLMTCAKKIPKLKMLYDNGFIFYPHVIPNMYVIRGNIPASGSLLKWCRDNLFQDIIEYSIKSKTDPYTMMFDKLSNEPSDIVVFPYFAGRGTPDIDPNAKGAILGLTLGSDRFDILKAIIEALTFELKQNVDAMEKIGFSFQEIRATGGGTKSEKWLRMKASITKHDVVAYANDAAPLGAVIIAAHGMGLYKSFRDIISLFVHPVKLIKPDKKYKWEYILQKRKEVICQLRKKTITFMERSGSDGF